MEGILSEMGDGKRVNGLIQGDVGCGKSIVCFLLAAALAENGYQSAIMTPNRILAEQHYGNLMELFSGTGIGVGYYAGDMQAKERKKILAGLADGSIQVIVGTTSLIAPKVVYKDLALAVVDEEHKFGVMQRGNLADKGQAGVHTLVMSATPIPRTLAQTVYNKNMELYSIKSMPPGRKRTLSCVTDSTPGVLSFLRKELQAGHQAYIVCAMIGKDEKPVFSVEEAEEMYGSFIRSLGYSYAAITGKTPQEEMGTAMDCFRKNEIQVIIATSVIEVGVNVPNATALVIHNAERFGMAALHQMRGRVGRGSAQSYCVFFSEDTGNERLQAVSKTTDGCEIALKDLQMRSAGDLLRGTRQSGRNKYLEMILANQERYKDVQDAVEWLGENGAGILEAMQDSFYKKIE